jgi:histidinol-phosphate aminotransferase
MELLSTLIHGGPDALGVPAFDFSSNQNAAGPCPSALAAVQAADCRHYPDPHYTQLRRALAAFYQVDDWRIVIGASSSELIFRLSALAAQAGTGSTGSTGNAKVWLPAQHYGDYARAAQLLGLQATPDPDAAKLVWWCEPSSPRGQLQPDLLAWFDRPQVQQMRVLDGAYEPLRLEGESLLTRILRDKIWQLFSPNKALGMTGVRGAFCIAPQHAGAQVKRLNAMAASWPLGAHGVAMLHAWVQPEAQDWLAHSLPLLRQWKAEQIALCEGKLGWVCQPSIANFYTATAPVKDLPHLLAQLRSHGVKLRDCASFGLPGVLRMAALPPAAHSALKNAWLQSTVRA